MIRVNAPAYYGRNFNSFFESWFYNENRKVMVLQTLILCY